MTKLIDSNRTPAVETLFEYNLDNLLKKKTYADGKFVEYTPDKMGLITSVETARNITKTYTYDGNHNLLNMDYSDTTPDVTFIYDDYNRVLTRADGTGTYNYTYYADDRLWTVDGPLANDTITYQYNELGNLKNLTPLGGQAITYGYDYESTDPNIKKIGRLLNIQSGANTFTYDYSGVNPLIQKLTRPNGSFTEYLYSDPLKKLTDVFNKNSTSQVINSYSYTYYTSGTSTDLIQYETITNGEPIDNFIEGTTTYTPNSLNQLVSTSNPNRAYLYDDDGNMTSGFTPEGYALTMTYDAENRLKTAEYIDSSNIVHRTEYLYNGESLIAEVKKYQNSTLVNDTKYLRNGFLPVQERDGSNNVAREYTWGLNSGGGIGGLLNLRQNSNDYSYLYDGKGNVASLISGSQSVVANYRYDPFGVLMKKTATIEQPYTFSTKPYDEGTGLIDYGFRFYSSEIGKWMSRDPLGERSDINLYRTVGNNSLNWIDPWGDAQVYIWYPKDRNVGHSSIKTDLGEYGSFWPEGNWKIDAQGTFNTYEGDIRSEGRVPDVIIDVTGVDEKAMTHHIKNLKRDAPNYQWRGNNCTDFVEDTLRQGGAFAGIKPISVNTPPSLSTRLIIREKLRNLFNLNK